MRTELAIRDGYGKAVPWVSRLDDGSLKAVSGPDMIVLHGPVSLHVEGLMSICEFTVSAGERMPFVLTYCPSHLPAPAHIDPEAALAETEASWTEWSARGNTAGEWSDAVKDRKSTRLNSSH